MIMTVKSSKNSHGLVERDGHRKKVRWYSMTDDILSVFIRGRESAAVGEFSSVKLQLRSIREDKVPENREGRAV